MRGKHFGDTLQEGFFLCLLSKGKPPANFSEFIDGKSLPSNFVDDNTKKEFSHIFRSKLFKSHDGDGKQNRVH